MQKCNTYIFSKIIFKQNEVVYYTKIRYLQISGTLIPILD